MKFVTIHFFSLWLHIFPNTFLRNIALFVVAMEAEAEVGTISSSFLFCSCDCFSRIRVEEIGVLFPGRIRIYDRIVREDLQEIPWRHLCIPKRIFHGGRPSHRTSYG